MLTKAPASQGISQKELPIIDLVITGMNRRGCETGQLRGGLGCPEPEPRKVDVMKRFFLGRLPNGDLAICCSGTISDKEILLIKELWELYNKMEY